MKSEKCKLRKAEPARLAAVLLTEPVLEYACHEGNYAVHNMLSASRAEEKDAEEAAKK